MTTPNATAIDARSQERHTHKARRLAAILSSAVLVSGIASTAAALKTDSNTSSRGGATISQMTISLPGAVLELYRNDYGRQGRSYAGRFLLSTKGVSFSYSRLADTYTAGFGIPSFSCLFEARKVSGHYDFSSQTY